MTYRLIITVIYILGGLVVYIASYQIRCVENGRFYRDPDRPPHKTWTTAECSKYYLCLEGEVFEFQCSSGLLFDTNGQICNSKDKVVNCDIAFDHCHHNMTSCKDGTCLPAKYFCDGSLDCLDGSDEENCKNINDPYKAQSCNSENCHLPECYCYTNPTEIPGHLKVSQVPQMILVSFDGAVNYENWEIFDKLFDGKWKNPNGCPISATFFINHLNNNYYHTQKLWNEEHEIAVHSISSPKGWWSYNATLEDWFDEMVGQANILHKFGSIRLNEIRGLRAPFLEVGWNRQFLMMEEFGFVYDSSVIAPVSNAPFWPYSLDYKPPHRCIIDQNCPSRAYPKLWEMVINPLEMEDGTVCSKLEFCPNLTADEVYKTLLHNFNRHYRSNRAPFGIHLQAKFLSNSDYFEAFQDFIADVLDQGNDVWFVTNWQAISWIKNPVPANKINLFKEWNCGKLFRQKEIACKIPNVCKLSSKAFRHDKYLYTCSQCPHYYPWLKNEFGYQDENII